jgi:uncharacterized protein YqfB (UPF0267 family)
MPALNFKKQFAPLVATGQKKQTIRAMRKRPFRANDVLFLYTGMRTKNCAKILDTVCKSVEDITIDPKNGQIKLGDNYLSDNEIIELAKADGFDCVEDFYSFFEKNNTEIFVGQLIKWEN